jgi:hypothetical protein
MSMVQDQTYSQRMRTWIIVVICASVVAIVIGLLIPKTFSTAKIVVPQVMFFAGFLSLYIMPWIYPAEKVNSQRDFNVGLSVFSIWFLFPLSAGVNAWIYAIGVYDPITDDGYRYSIEYWWFGVISQIVLGVLLTMYYLRGSFLQINAGWHPKLFWYSWGLQLVLWLILGFGPELNS